MNSQEFKKGSLNYSQTKLLIYKKKQVKNREYVLGFLSGFIFNFFAVFGFCCFKSKHYKEGIFIGWIYFLIFIIFTIMAFLIDLKVNQRILA